MNDDLYSENTKPFVETIQDLEKDKKLLTDLNLSLKKSYAALEKKYKDLCYMMKLPEYNKDF